MLDEVVEAVVVSDSARLERALTHWPALAPLVPGLLQDANLEGRLLALWVLSHELRRAGEWIVAGHLAASIVAALVRAGAATPSAPDRLRSLLASVATHAASTLTDAGLGKETLARGDEWVAALQAAGLPQEAAALKLPLAESAIMVGAYERAATWLDDFQREHTAPDQNAIYLRLANKMDGLLRAVDQPDRPDTPFATILGRSAESVAKGIPAFETIVGLISDPSATASERSAAQWGATFEREATSFGFPARVEGMSETAGAIEALDASGSPRFLLHKIVQSCGRILGTIAREDREAHFALATLARRAREKAQAFDQWEESQTLGWIAAVCLRRTGAHADAAGVLKELRDSLRSRQLRIRDPRLRAALAMHLPYLAGTSAEVLFSLGEAAVAELFETIESAKSGILADLIDERRGGPQGTGIAAVQHLLQSDPERACYCTFLIAHPPGVDPADDDTTTYAVLVPRSGAPVATRLALGRATLAAAVEELRRLNEGGGRKGEYDDWSNLGPLLPRAPWERPYDEVLEILRPLAAWFASLLAAGVLRDNDVLCLALDGPLFGLPLQALEVGGVPLGVRFACTVVPSASVLLACAAARNQQPRRRPVAAVVPLASEDEAKARRNVEALGRHAEVELLGGPSADLACMQAAPLSQVLLHIAAHGLFDPRDPLRRSGVVLARNGAYPPGRDALSGTLLTPNDLAQLNLLGTHLSFRACVSGRTTEVTSREALGMIWAAFTAGASSIIAGQWDVYIPSAASLLDELYEAAVDQPVLARAYRHALERVRSESPAYAHPYHFCGLAYYGYWR